MKYKSLWKSKYLNDEDEYSSTYELDIDFFNKESDENKSEELLIHIMMERYGITKEDMKDITIVKSKLRDVNIDQILK